MKKYHIRNDFYLTVILAIIIFLVNIRHITLLNGPFMFPDELGYLGNAAVMVGKDWHEVMQYCIWYGYGWSIILVPLFLIFSNMQIIYRCINVLNAFLVVGIFLIQRHLFRRIFKDVAPCVITAVAACVCFYPSILVNSSIAWSEVWLMFVFTALTVFLSHMIQRPRAYKAAVFGILLYYFYVCHNRMITVVLTGTVVFLVLVFTGVIKRRDSLFFFGALVLSGVIFGLMKAWIVAARGGVPSGADIETALAHLPYLTTVDGLKNFTGVLLGQFLYSCVASCGMAQIALYASARKIILAIKQHKIEESLLEIWLVFTFFGVLSTSAIFLGTQPEILNMEIVLNGRYFDFIVIILLSYGLLYLAELKRDTGHFAIYMAGYVCAIGICALAAHMVIVAHQFSNIGLNKACMAGISFVTDQFTNPTFAMALFSVIGTMLFVELFNHKDTLKYVAICGFVSLCLLNAHSAEANTFIGNQEYYKLEVPLVNFISEFDFADLPVYILSSYNENAYFQCELVDIPLKYSPGFSLTTIPDERYYVIISSQFYISQGFNVYSEPIAHGRNHLFLYVDKTNENTNRQVPILLERMYLMDISNWETDHIHVKSTDAALAFYGPYIGMETGNYRLNVTLNVESDEELQSYGRLQIISASRQSVFGETEITNEFVNTATGTLSVPFSLEEDINDIEIYLQTSPDTAYDIYSLTLERDFIFDYMLNTDELDFDINGFSYAEPRGQVDG